MSLFTIADLHLSFMSDKPMDIFKGWENYTQRLEENWNNLVTADDVVVIIGDVSWAMNYENAYEDFKFINSNLNGKKIIIRGNHDYWFTTKASFNKYLIQNNFNNIEMLYNNSYEYGNIAICGSRGWVNETNEECDKKILLREAGRLRLSLEDSKKYDKKPIVFLHYPPIFNTSECVEILDILYAYNIEQCYYGHIHGYSTNFAFNGLYNGINYNLVSCDYTQFKPIKVL